MLAQIWTGVWVTFWALFGGVLHYINSVKEDAQKWQKFRFCADLITASGAGWITWMLCKWANLDYNLSAVLIGVSGHMGTRSLFLLEKFVEIFYDKTAKIILSEEDLKDYERKSKRIGKTNDKS